MARVALGFMLAVVAGTAQESVSFPSVDGGVVQALAYGKGDRGVVLAHGGRFNKESWAKQAPVLAAAEFRVVAIDFRGYGRSTGPGSASPMDAPLHLDVLAAVRYLREAGAKRVFAVGGSLGGGAAAEASIVEPGAIERLVMLGATPEGAVEKLGGRTLFIMAKDDASGSGPRLPRLMEQYAKVKGRKELIVLDGSAHAQFLFQTEHADRVMREIVRFLTAR